MGGVVVLCVILFVCPISEPVQANRGISYRNNKNSKQTTVPSIPVILLQGTRNTTYLNNLEKKIKF